MRSNAKKTFYFHADANSLGGFIDKPFQKAIPPQAAISLPPVGGHATARTDAFNFEEIISCRSAYTKVSGRLVAEDGPGSALVTSVVEGLNILEVVKAERIVAQIAVEHSGGDDFSQIHFTGSCCEGLKIGGYDASSHIQCRPVGECWPEQPGSLSTGLFFSRLGSNKLPN